MPKQHMNFIKKAQNSQNQKYWDFPMSGNTVVCLQTQLVPIIHRGQLCVDSIYTPSDMNFQAILMPKVILAN